MHCSTACPMVLGANFSRLRNTLDVDVKNTNPREFKMVPGIRKCVLFGNGWTKRTLCNCPLCLPYSDLHSLMHGIISVKSERPKAKSQTLSTLEHSVLSLSLLFPLLKVLPPALPVCHTYFNYLTGL